MQKPKRRIALLFVVLSIFIGTAFIGTTFGSNHYTTALAFHSLQNKINTGTSHSITANSSALHKQNTYIKSGPGGLITAECTDSCSPYTSQQSQTGCSYSFYYTPQQSQGMSEVACDASENIFTYYPTYNNYEPSSYTLANTYTYSPANEVNATNAQQAPYLLTCPTPYSSDEHPTDQSYFTNYPGIAGEACINTQSSLTTQISLPLTISWSPTSLASASVGNMYVSNPGSMIIDIYAYSPMLSQAAGGSISNGFTSSSYVFKQVPSVAQHAVWTWSAVFALFGDAQIPNQLSVTVNPQYDALFESDPLGFSQQTASKITTSTYTFSSASSSSQSTDSYVLSTTSSTSTTVPSTTSITTTSPGFVQSLAQANYAAASSSTTSISTSTTSTSTTSTSTTISYECIYQYTYTANLNLQNIQNTFIPFNEITGTVKLGNKVQLLTNTFNAMVLPYLLFNYQMPSPGGATLQNSYDIFSPWNYYNPANTEEPFTIDTPGRFYINYSGTLINILSNTLTNPNDFGNLLNNLISILFGNSGSGNGLQKVQNEFPMYGLRSPYISDPISIAAIPNDYVFVLNESNPPYGDYYLSVLRLIPKGYYNTTNNPPTSMENTSASTYTQAEEEWVDEWNNYWPNIINEQNETTYVINSFDLSSMFPGFTPMNISANYAGDIFISGYSMSGYGRYISQSPDIVGILNALSSNPTPIQLSSNWQAPSGVSAFLEIATAPTGDLIFAATPSKGYIYSFNFSNTQIAPYGNISLSFGATEPSIGQQVLVNITDYLYNGGLYGVNFNGVAAPNVLVGGSFDPKTDFDLANYHHPLGLEDINGYLYVLDDWTGGLGNKHCGWLGIEIVTPLFTLGKCPITKFNILMLRVINSTGYGVPINPTNFNDIWQEQECSAVNQQGQPVDLSNQQYYTSSDTTPPTGITCTPSNKCTLTTIADIITTNGNIKTGRSASGEFEWGCVANTQTKSKTFYSLSTVSGITNYPPYGWPLSANITVNSHSTTFCSSSSCTYTPSTLPSSYTGGYKPIGPGIPSSYNQFELGFSVNFNDTVNTIFHTISNGYLCWNPSSWFWCTTSNPQYNELIVATRLNVQNYTKLFAGNPPYTCYTDSKKDSAKNGGACQYLKRVSNMYPPVYTMPDSFRYVENAGLQTMTFAGLLNSAAQNPSMGAVYYNAGPPSLSIESITGANGPSGEYLIYSVAKSPSDQLQLSVNNNVVATGTGEVTYTLDCNTGNSCSSSTPVSVTDVTTGVTTSASVSLQSGSGLAPSSITVPSASTTPYSTTGTPLTSSITGSLLVPYSYTYSLSDNLYNVQLLGVYINGVEQPAGTACQPPNDCQPQGCGTWINPPPSPSSSMSTTTVFTYALINTPNNELSSMVENAGTYFKDAYTQGLYVPQLNATIMPPNIYYYIESNRLFGFAYVNVTQCKSEGYTSTGIPVEDCAQNTQQVLNAQQTQQYNIVQYMQNTISGTINVFQEIQPLPTQINSPQLVSPSPNDRGVDIYASPTPSFSYTSTLAPILLPLFDFYQQLTYDSPMTLDASSYPGFRLFTFVFNDRFNNTIYVPMALDVANTVVLSINATTTPDQNNYNQTQISINGYAYVPSSAPGGPATPVPAGQKIYLYFNKNINYINYNAVTDPVNTMLCAYGAVLINGTSTLSTNVPTNCTLANPDWAGMQTNANLTTYHPSFNSQGVCNPPASSLLSINYQMCNLYNMYGLSATCPSTGSGAEQFCEPLYANGTGICTSQIGLFAIATTNSMGGFSTTITACGGGASQISSKIIAEYYGAPLQPLEANVLPLALQANVVNLASDYPNYLTVNELNYYYAPNETSTGVLLGMPMLNMGEISAAIFAAFAFATTMLLLYKTKNKKGSKYAQKAKSTSL